MEGRTTRRTDPERNTGRQKEPQRVSNVEPIRGPVPPREQVVSRDVVENAHVASGVGGVRNATDGPAFPTTYGPHRTPPTPLPPSPPPPPSRPPDDTEPGDGTRLEQSPHSVGEIFLPVDPFRPRVRFPNSSPLRSSIESIFVRPGSFL